MNGDYGSDTEMSPSSADGDYAAGLSNGHPDGINGHAGTREINGHVTGTTNGQPSDLSTVPIAICGIGLRLPGGLRSTEDLLQFLVNKGDARSVVPADRFNIDAYYDPAGRPGSIKTKYGYFLDLDLAEFDTSMFGMSNAEVAQLDPGQRLLLEVTREAFESAGEADFRGKNIGTFVGDFTVDWEDIQDLDMLHHPPYQMTGQTDFAIANRLAFEYDLLGPSTNLKTACSATAGALHDAILAIRSGSCPAAIVAGANLIMTPRGGIGMTSMGVLSADGSCKSFDASANGFARGESVCALYVKRLDDAIRDGSPVRAVVLACDSNADGGDGSRTFGTPNSIAQETLIRQTYAHAGLDLSETKVVECHGTGTPIGDPLETSAVARCFGGDDPVYIGSVKPNLGHGEAGSAMASIIKAVVALESRTILPNIKFTTPNPKIPWDRNLHVPTEPTPWPQGVKERISVNSYGLGGSNVHIVIDSAASSGVSPARITLPNDAQPGKTLLLLSGNANEAIPALSRNYGEYLQNNPDCTGSMAYTLACKRERLKLASYCIVDGGKVTDPPAASKDLGVRQVAFLFTGQGAQWIGMGREMMRNNAVFAKTIRDMDAVLRSTEIPPPWTLEETLLADGSDKDLLNPTQRSQPVCAAIQIAYVDALAAWNIHPCAVVGHSSGEVAAAYAAKILTSREAMLTAYYRGFACTKNTLRGGMAAIGLGRKQVEPHLQSGVVVACENSNASVTISGDQSALEESMAALRQAFPESFIRALRVPMAYHSDHMRKLAGVYRPLIEPHLTPRAPQTPYYSTVHGRQVREAEAFGPQYWQLNMESPVLFRTAVTRMLQDITEAAHLEIGPHSALAGPLRQIYAETGRSAAYASVAERGEDAEQVFLQAIGKLYTFGLSPTPPSVDGTKVLHDLPPYPWVYTTRHWAETRVMTGWRFRQHRRHELLGLRILESSDVEPAWRNLLRIKDVPWLADHCVGKDVVFPAAGYIAMAGAAVGQLSGTVAYTVQEVHIASAMLLTEAKPADIVTVLRRHTLTNAKDSEWWEFSISSESGGVWTKHCWGRVSDGARVPLPNPVLRSYTREIDARRWSIALSRIGLNYGPRFVGLQNISASPTEAVAAVTVVDRQDEYEPYALHPTTLDLALQSWSVAATHGVYRHLDTTFLPSFMGHFYVGDGADQEIRIQTKSRGLPGCALGDAYGVMNGEIVFSMYGFQGTRLDSPIGTQYAEQPALSIQWHPAINFASSHTLIRPTRDATAEIAFVEKFAVMAALEISHDMKQVESLALDHFHNFVASIERHVQRVNSGQSAVPDAIEIRDMSRSARQAKMRALREESLGGPFEASVEALWRVYDRIKDILSGREAYLDVLLKDDLLTTFYNEGNDLSDLADWFRVLGLNRPQLRVLEIGAGTGGTTALALEAMHSSHGERLYESYTITDVSAGFVSRCKSRFQNYSNLKFGVLDISADPLEQGYDPASFDLIVASNVLHATPSLIDTLTRCRSLLKPDGYLFMQELCAEVIHLDLVMGCFDGWWQGVDDGRPHRAAVNEEVWDDVLRKSGFDGIDAAIRDNQHEKLFRNANIITRPQVDTDTPDRVTLLKIGKRLSSFGTAVKNALAAAGKAIDECVWGEDTPLEGQDIVSLIDLESDGPLLARLTAEDLAEFVQTVENAFDDAILWLMPSAHVKCTNPGNGQVLGVARGIRAELAIDFVTLELDSQDDAAATAVAELLQEVQRQRAGASEEADILLESEYAWQDGKVLISRAHSFSLSAALVETGETHDAKHLFIGQRGMLQTMGWAGHTFAPLAADEVHARVSAAGLNFHDVAMAIGIIQAEHSEEDGYHALGSEGTAVVTAVGKDVSHVSVGDRVIIMDKAVLATEIQAPAVLCAKIPDSLSDVDAAGMIIPYLTVLWSLCEKGALKRGQSLLVHSAAGGVGIAAVNVARWMGLTVFCTVSSEEKKAFLVDQLGVPRSNIFYSRNESFVADVLSATDGKGVDAVLNSLSGELLHATWQCVAPFGCMLDLGKRDFIGYGQLAMNPFLLNRAYFGIDLSTIAYEKPALLAPYMSQIIQLYQQGHLQELRPTTVYEAADVQDAFRYMQKGVHIGRIVIRMPENSSDISTSLVAPKPRFATDATYLLVGGVGGLGQAIILWMVQNGARRIMAVSPSAGKRPSHAALIQDVRESGCELRCFAGDVADRSFMENVIAAAGDRPIRGVLQMAMVLQDVSFLNLDIQAWKKVTDPKVRGTWNLHDLLREHELDFFVMAASVSGALGSHGQSNYAAGNAFLDTMVAYRHNLGLPAAVLDVSAVGDVGYVASRKEVTERLERAGARFMTEQEFLTSLHLAIQRSSAKYVVAPTPNTTVLHEELGQILLQNEMTTSLADPENTTPWRRDPRMAIFRNIDAGQLQSGQGGSEGLRGFVMSLSHEPEKLDDPATVKLVAEEISKRVCSFLMKEEAVGDITQSLSSMGADSLVAIEIRNWWKQTLGVEISVLELADAGSSMESLGALAVERLREKFAPKGDAQ